MIYSTITRKRRWTHNEATREPLTFRIPSHLTIALLPARMPAFFIAVFRRSFKWTYAVRDDGVVRLNVISWTTFYETTFVCEHNISPVGIFFSANYFFLRIYYINTDATIFYFLRCRFFYHFLWVQFKVFFDIGIPQLHAWRQLNIFSRC